MALSSEFLSREDEWFFDNWMVNLCKYYALLLTSVSWEWLLLTLLLLGTTSRCNLWTVTRFGFRCSTPTLFGQLFIGFIFGISIILSFYRIWHFAGCHALYFVQFSLDSLSHTYEIQTRIEQFHKTYLYQHS